MPIRFAIVNDYEVVVRGLAAMLTSTSDDFTVVELDARGSVDEPVDIALLDTFGRVRRNERTGVVDLVANPLVDKVVVYSWNLARPDVAAARGAGAAGYLSKGLDRHELVEALLRVHAGEDVVADAEVAVDDDADDAAVQDGDWPGREHGLAPREASVVALISQGLSNREIATETGLTLNTVKTYIRAAYRKMGVRTRSQAVLWGIEHGLLPDRRRLMDPDQAMAR